MARTSAAGSAICAAVALLACDPKATTETNDATTSPQASAIPAPLANAPTTSSALPTVTSPDSGPPPVPLRPDLPLPADSAPAQSIGYTFSAVLRPGDLVGPPRAPEVASAGLDAARKKTELRIAIDLAASRMRVALLGPSWVLPADSEIRARADRYGHVFVWGGASYRPLAPGSLRALIGERRFDVAPITSAEVIGRDDTSKRIGVKTRLAEVSTRAAKATFEIGRLSDLGDGGNLLCRMLLDLMNAPPSTALCGDSELPMRAELRWTGKGSIAFEITGVLKKTDLVTTGLLVPPPSASLVGTPLPPPPNGVAAILPPPDLAAFRSNPVEPPPNAAARGDALTVHNATDQLRVLYVDGVAVAWASPGGRDVLPGFLRGRYVAQWRTFLGESFEAPVALIVPGTAQVGAIDAGVR
ncbi:MAG: hypothetical protein JST00_37890 [Deltaproteobacteria bacterium]|nr:hypothetical protein [Deltaproteobacteria bacterium]